MLRGLHNAASGLKAQQQKMDVTAHNIANVNTTGYKKKDTLFQDLVYQSIARKGNAVVPPAQGQNPVSAGVGSAVAAVRSDLRAGTFLQTDRKLDLAIVGDGYFRVLLPDETMAFTRDGGFSKDTDGNLVTSKGHRVLFPPLPEGEYELVVTPGGECYAQFPAGEQVHLGRLELAYFANPRGLEQTGDNLLAATANSGAAQLGMRTESTKLMQGYLEGSNVNLSEEMVQLITSQRSFAINSRALRTVDEMWSIANQLRR